jgi:hypothetical protein
MPKAQRANSTNNNKKNTNEYYFIVFGAYDRGVGADSEEKAHNTLCIDCTHHRSFISREAVLFSLYEAAISMDDKVRRGSMTITGIQCVTKNQLAIWHESTGILRTAGWDTASKGKVTNSV